MDVTLFCCRAVASCWAFSSSIWSPWRLSAVSFYMKRWKG
jgi:hypothetical protein